MSVKMNFGNLKYAIGSSRAIKLSKSRGPSSNNENSSTINLSTKSNVENILAKKNLQLKGKNEKSEKLIDSNIASIKAIPIAGKNSKHINKIQFISQSDRNKIKEKEMETNLNSNTNFLTNLNTNSLPKKSEENPLTKSKHQKTSSEIPRNMAINNYFYENFHSLKNPRENSNKKRELLNNIISNTNRNKFLIVNDTYNSTTNTVNKEDYDRAELDFNINMNITNHPKLGKNVFRSVERKNEKLSSKIVNSERNESKFMMMNMIDVKYEDDKIKKLNISKEKLMKNFGDDKKNSNLNSFTKSESNLNNSNCNQNFNLNEQILMNRELIKTVEILNTYIKTTQAVTEDKKNEVEKKLKQKDDEIKKLKVIKNF